MPASALNAASIPPAGAAAHGAKASAVAAGGAAAQGFEALMAALFPQPCGVPLPVAGAAPNAHSAGMAKDEAEAKPGEGLAGAIAGDSETMPPDAAAALAASVAGAQAGISLSLATPEAGSKAAGDGGKAAPPAWGRDKAQGDVAAPAALHANPNAALGNQPAAAIGAGADTSDIATAEPLAIATDDANDGGEHATQGLEGARTPPAKESKGSPAAAANEPPAWGRDKAPGAPAAPALENASPAARLSEKAAQAVLDTPPADPAPTDQPPAATPLASLTQQPQPAPPPPARAGGKSERIKTPADASPSTDATPADAADKPSAAKSAEAAPKPPSTADVDGAEAKAEHGKAAPAEPEGVPQGETRAAAQSAAPAMLSTHAVRGAPETVANLAAQILKKLEGKSTRFDLELDPAGLGKVDVRLEIGAQGRLTAAMTCDNPQAAAELRSRASELQRALEQAGFNLSGGLSFDVAGDRGQQQGQAWQDQADNGGRGFRGHAFQAALDTAGDAADAADQGALKLRRGVTAGLDLRI